MATQIDKGCLMLLEKLDSVANSDKSIDIWRYKYMYYVCTCAVFFVHK